MEATLAKLNRTAATALGAAIAASLVLAIVRVVMGGSPDELLLAAVAIVAAAGGIVLLALAYTGRMRADWATIAASAPVTYLVLSTAPRSASFEAWPVARLILALSCAAAYLWLALPMGRRIQYGVCCATMGVAAVFFTLWEPPPPKPVPIAKHLALLEAEVLQAMPGWTAKSQPMPAEVEKALGADEYLNLELTAPAGDYRVLVFITYNASAMSQVPHVPWVCMTQAGYRLKDMRQDDLPIAAIPGKEIEANVMLFEGGEGHQAARALMIQYFNVGGTYAWNRQVARFLATSGSLGQKGSFLSQTQVAVWLSPGSTEDPSEKTSRAYRIATEFVNVLVPLLEREYYPNLSGAEPASPRNKTIGDAPLFPGNYPANIGVFAQSCPK
jgi:hypothetical protein